jgi:hypothetical protein
MMGVLGLFDVVGWLMGCLLLLDLLRVSGIVVLNWLR